MKSQKKFQESVYTSATASYSVYRLHEHDYNSDLHTCDWQRPALRGTSLATTGTQWHARKLRRKGEEEKKAEAWQENRDCIPPNLQVQKWPLAVVCAEQRALLAEQPEQAQCTLVDRRRSPSGNRRRRPARNKRPCITRAWNVTCTPWKSGAGRLSTRGTIFLGVGLHDVFQLGMHIATIMHSHDRMN